jgi:hypothetical protein
LRPGVFFHSANRFSIFRFSIAFSSGLFSDFAHSIPQI